MLSLAACVLHAHQDLLYHDVASLLSSCAISSIVICKEETHKNHQRVSNFYRKKSKPFFVSLLFTG